MGKKSFFNRSNLKTRLGNRPYFVYNPHTEPCLTSPDEDAILLALKESRFSFEAKVTYRDVVTIDPGIVNCAIYVERWWSDGREELIGCDLFSPLEEESNDYTKILKGGEKFIDTFLSRFLCSHFILVESQMFINMRALTLMQHILSSLLVLLKDRGLNPLIIEINPECKTKMLGAPIEVKTKPDRKKWCIKKAQEILTTRGEEGVSNSLFVERSKKGQGKKKKDDIADGVCMARVWKLFAIERGEWCEGSSPEMITSFRGGSSSKGIGRGRGRETSSSERKESDGVFTIVKRGKK